MKLFKRGSTVKLVFCAITLSPLFTSCSKYSTNPRKAFQEVKEEVALRSGIVCSEAETSLCEPLTLDRILQLALSNNPEILATYQDLGVAQADLVQSTLFQNPIFSCSLRYENLVERASIIEMGLVQNLLDIILKPMKVKMACAELSLVKKRVTAEVLDLIREATAAYYTLQAAESTLLLQQENLEITAASHEVAQRLYEAGNINELALKVEALKCEQAKIELSQSEVLVEEAREELNVLMGFCQSNQEWQLAKTLELKAPECTLSDLEDYAINKSLDLQIARENIRKTGFLLGIQTAETIIPQLTFGPDSEKDPGEPWFLGPQFSVGVPLFDIGHAKRARQRAELKKLKNQYVATAVKVRAETRFLTYRMLNAWQRCKRYEEILIPLEEEVTEKTLKQLNAMQVGVFDLLAAKKHEIETKMKAIETYKEYWHAQTDVETLLSGRMIKRW